MPRTGEELAEPVGALGALVGSYIMAVNESLNDSILG